MGALPAVAPPRLANGQPDLQGIWDFRTLTPLQRPEELADHARLADDEAAAIESLTAERLAASNAPSDVRSEPLPAGGSVGAYNLYWIDQDAKVVDDRRTSLLVDPPDGRLPPLRPGIEMQVLSNSREVSGRRPNRTRAAGVGADTYEDRGLSERCLVGFNTGPPIMPGFYNQNVQIFQTADHVVILNEIMHDARIVPLDGRAPLLDGIRQWMGDSRGYWDGDTLVVETTNFTEKTASFNPTIDTAAGTGTTLHLTERFRGWPSTACATSSPSTIHPRS